MVETTSEGLSLAIERIERSILDNLGLEVASNKDEISRKIDVEIERALYSILDYKVRMEKVYAVYDIVFHAAFFADGYDSVNNIQLYTISEQIGFSISNGCILDKPLPANPLEGTTMRRVDIIGGFLSPGENVNVIQFHAHNIDVSDIDSLDCLLSTIRLFIDQIEKLPFKRGSLSG